MYIILQCICHFISRLHGHHSPAQALKPDGSTVGKIPLNRGKLKVFNCGHLFLLTRADEMVRVMNEFLDRPDMNGRQQ